MPKNLANFIRQVADLLRGDYKSADCGKIIMILIGATTAPKVDVS
jgi:hypothetical protein